MTRGPDRLRVRRAAHENTIDFLFSLIRQMGCVRTGFPVASSCSNSGLLCCAELSKSMVRP
jgi:hypothetical protein